MDEKDIPPLANPWNEKHVHEILPNLFLSGIDGTVNLHRYGITIVVSTCQDSELSHPLGLGVKHIRIPVKDDSKEDLRSHFRSVNALIHSYRKEGQRVLVHCVAGASRSPTFVMAYLMDTERMTLLEAYHLVKTKRRIVEPEYGFLIQLLDWERELFIGLEPSIDSKLGWPTVPDTRIFLCL